MCCMPGIVWKLLASSNIYLYAEFLDIPPLCSINLCTTNWIFPICQENVVQLLDDSFRRLDLYYNKDIIRILYILFPIYVYKDIYKILSFIFLSFSVFINLRILIVIVMHNCLQKCICNHYNIQNYQLLDEFIFHINDLLGWWCSLFFSGWKFK